MFTYPLDDLLECFGAILSDVSLSCGNNVVGLGEGVLHVGDVPYIDFLLARDDVGAHHVVVHRRGSIEVWYD